MVNPLVFTHAMVAEIGLLSGLIFLLGFAVAGMGAIISSGCRTWPSRGLVMTSYPLEIRGGLSQRSFLADRRS